MHDGDAEWGCRAAAAEQAVVRRHLRPIAGVLPGTRIGRVRWPRRLPTPPFPWQNRGTFHQVVEMTGRR